MGVTAAWRRQGLRATAVTLFIPGAVMLAVATALLGGGLRGLGSLQQLVTGPQVPEARLGGQALPPHRSGAHLPSVPAAPASAAQATGTGTAPSAGAAPGAGRRPLPVAVAPPRRPSAARPPAATSSAPAAAAQPQQRPARDPGPVRSLGERLAGDVGALPPPAGPAGRDIITTVLDIVAPPPAAAAAGAATAAPPQLAG
jgi:hypothetical protein